MEMPSRAILDIELNEIGYGRYAMQAFNNQLGAVKDAIKLPADELLYTIRQIRSGGGDVEGIRHVGSNLFRGLGQALRDYWDEYLSMAQSTGRLSLIRLKLSSEELSQLPWEMMFDLQGRPLAEYVSVVRTPIGVQPFRPVTIPRYMRLLVATAAPSDYPNQHIDAILDALRQGLAPAESSNFRSTITRHTTSRLLAQELSTEPVQLLHFIGHVSGGDSYRKSGLPEGLVLESEEKDSELCAVSQVGSLLKKSAISLLVLDAPSAVPPGIGARLINEYAAAAVVTNQFELADHSAMSPFWTDFYRVLSNGRPVDEALFRARIRLMDWPGLGSSAWAGPVLTMTGDGQLFDLPGRLSVGEAEMTSGLESMTVSTIATRDAGGESLESLIQQRDSLEAAMAVFGGHESAPESLKLRWKTLQNQIDQLKN